MKNGTYFESLFPKEAWQDEIAKIVTLVKEGNSCELVSLPGVGRSTLLRLLVYNTGVRRKHLGEQNAKVHFVLCNFSELASANNPNQTAKFLFLSLVESLRERKFTQCDAVAAMFQESVTLNDPLILFSGLKRAVDFLTTKKKLTLVFLLDRLETYVPMLTDTLFANLQALQEHASYRFATVFSVARPLEEVLDATTFPHFYTLLRGRSLFLRLSDDVGLLFGLSYLEKAAGKKLSEKTKEEVIRISAGHAKLATVAAEELLASSYQRLAAQSNVPAASDAASSSELRTFLSDNRAVRSVSYEIWEALTPEERRLLLDVILTRQLAGKNPDPSSRSGGTQDDKAGKDYLEHVGLLKNGAITIPLFEAFIKYRAEHPVKEKITLESPLADKLTKAEYQLLKFLLENQGRIVEREKVIQAVWSDLKSQAGITDQALDQLVLRLRKKIEDDPSNPTHLLTVKGRGFRFTT